MKKPEKTGSHAILVTKDKRVILQQKDLKYKINPINCGKVSMYGGGAEKQEDARDTLHRELQEELNVTIPTSSMQKLGTYHKTIAQDDANHPVHVFIVDDVNVDELDPDFSDNEEANSAFVIDTPSNILKRSDLTRITQMALVDYCDKINL